MNTEAAYQELVRISREEAMLASCMELLGWDEETYMPRGGLAHRGEQMALIAGLCHDRATDPRVEDLLAVVEGSDLTRDPESPPAVNAREWRRTHDRLTRLPRSLVEELARLTSFAQQEWATARQDADYPRFQPWLEKILALKRQEAECLGYVACPYDALLEEYEPGANSADLQVLFDGLRAELSHLANAVTHANRKAKVAILHREYPEDRQRTLAETAASAIGFDFERGRMDATTHPFFSSIGPGDCRITTRFRTNDFSEAFFAILHEAGHGLYEQGLDATHHGTPMGQAASLGMHESQARLWENLVGRSRAFWQGFFPVARRVFPGPLRGVSVDAFHFALNHVEPSFYRVGADEVTYNLHVLIRFELEKAMTADDLRPVDLPDAWNTAYRRYLGVTPTNDAEGCLQDGHWSAGMFGYFPTYTLGNVFAAQMFAKAGMEARSLEADFARNRFDGLLSWLRERIHRQGGRFRAAQLMERTTGEAPSSRPLLEMLRRKYGELYGL